MEEDMILPEDFSDIPTEEPKEEVTVEEEPTGTVDEHTNLSEGQSEPTEAVQEQPKVKVVYDQQERELTIEEAAVLAQKGMNYERAIERARQEAAQHARDTVIAEMGMRDFDGRPITTEERYREVLREKEIREKYSDLPDEVREELLAGRKDREERQREKEEKETQAKLQADLNDFFQYFESVNERQFDPNKDVLPDEVVAATQKGVPLKMAYMEHHNKELRNQLKIQSQNQDNKRKAPISGVTTNGGTKTESSDPFMEGFKSI